MTAKYWFARRFPVGHRRNAMGPVSPEGWRVTGVFVMSVVAGMIGGFLLLTSGSPLLGLALFVVLSALGGLAFVVISARRGDRERTIEDYRSGLGRNADAALPDRKEIGEQPK